MSCIECCRGLPGGGERSGIQHGPRAGFKAASLLAFDTLDRSAVHYLTISDDEAVAAVTDLANHGLHTTPSGGAGFAAWQQERAAGLPVGSRPLIFMSEQAI